MRYKSIPTLTAEQESRFWSKVEKTPQGCWLWKGCIAGNGYGTVSLGGSQYRSHRVAYSLAIGPISAEMTLDHVWARGCRYKHCVNPAHLEPVTFMVNLMRGNSPCAIHARKTHCVHGHEFTTENTYIHPRTGYRSCNMCRREKDRRNSARKNLVNTRY